MLLIKHHQVQLIESGKEIRLDNGMELEEMSIRFDASQWSVAQIKNWLAERSISYDRIEPAIQDYNEESEFRMTAGLEVREEGADDEPRLVGYGAVFYNGNADTEFRLPGFTERIMPGAFDDILGNDIRGLFNHDPGALLGRTSADTMRLAIDKTGLQYDISVPDTKLGRDVRILVGRKDITGSSFSFRVTPEGQNLYYDANEVLIREIRKFASVADVGPVTFPAYEGTAVYARSFDQLNGLEEEERKLKDEFDVKTKLAQVNARTRVVELTK